MTTTKERAERIYPHVVSEWTCSSTEWRTPNQQLRAVITSELRTGAIERSERSRGTRGGAITHEAVPAA